MKDDLFLTEQYENEDREIDTFVISFNNLLGSLGPMPDISTIKRPQPLLPPPPPPPPTTTTATSSYNKPSSSGALLTLSSSPVKKLGADRVGSIGSRRTACRPTTAPTTRLQHHHPLSHQSDAHASKIYRPKSAGIFPASGRRLAGEFENNGKPIELSSVRLQKGLKRATKRANSLNAKTFFSVSASSTASIEANSVQAPRLINGGGGARCGIVAQTQRKQSATSFDQELLSRLHATAEADKAPAIYQDNAGVSSPGDFQQYESGQWRDKSRPQSAVISRVQSRPESAIATFSRPISAKTITRPRSAYSTRTFSSRPSSSFMRASSAASNSSSGYTPVYEARFNELKSVSDNVLDQANRKRYMNRGLS